MCISECCKLWKRCNGVQAAANLYFGKDIQDCDLAECAAIAGITQNPYKYTPLLHPEANKERQQTVLTEMYNQGAVTKQEYDQAMEKSANMTFVGRTSNSEEEKRQFLFGTGMWKPSSRMLKMI